MIDADLETKKKFPDSSMAIWIEVWSMFANV